MQSCVVLYRSSSRAAPASSSSALGRTFGGASFLLFTFGEGENSFHFEVKPGRGTRARARDSAMQGSWREEQSRASAAVLAASNAMSKNTLLRQYVAEPTAAASCSSLGGSSRPAATAFQYAVEAGTTTTV